MEMIVVLKDRIHRIKILLLLLFLPITAQATNSLLFLNQPLSARSLGMGGAFTAVSDDASATVSNPGGLDYVVVPELTGLYNQGIMDTYFTSVSGLYPAPWGSVGVAFSMFNGGSVDVQEENGASQSYNAEQDYNLDAAYGLHLTDWFFLGAGAKFIQSQLAGYQGSTYAFDLGSIIKLPIYDDRFTLGLAMQNYSPSGITYLNSVNNLPLTFSTGVSYQVMDSLSSSLIVAVDGIFENTQNPALRIGAEYGYQILNLRAGYTGSQPSFGGGFKFASSELDYCYTTLLGDSTNLISYSYRFGMESVYDMGEGYYDKGLLTKAIIEWKKADENDPDYKLISRRIDEVKTELIRMEMAKRSDEQKAADVKARAQSAFDALDAETNRKKAAEKAEYESPRMEVSVKLIDASGKGVLRAGENATLYFTVRNKGKGPALDAVASVILAPLSSFVTVDKTTVELGNIESKGSGEGQFVIAATDDTPADIYQITIKVEEKKGFDAKSQVLTFKSTPLEPPSLVLTGHTERGRVAPNESFTLDCQIQNKGKGAARDVEVELVGDQVNIPYGTQRIGDMEPGKIAPVSFTVIIPGSYTDKMTSFQVKIREKRERFNAEGKVTLTMGEKSEEKGSAYVSAPGTAGGSVVYPPSDVDINIPSRGSALDDSVAVVIGVRDYENGDVPAVEYAIHDAQTVKEYLTKTLGYSDASIISLENPTKANMEGVFGTANNPNGRLANRINPGKTNVFVYYSGHGYPGTSADSGGQAYFLPKDCDPQVANITGYPLAVFYKNLSELRAASVTVVIEACFSGGSDKGTLVKGASPIVLTQQWTNQIPKGINVFAASQEDQIATWYADKSHGVFTYFFLKGLQQGINRSGDMQDYLQKEVPQLVRKVKGNRDQVPFFAGDADRGIRP